MNAVAQEASKLEGALVAANQQLEEARTREAEAAAKLEAATGAVERARAADEASKADRDKLAAEKARWRERGDRNWEGWDAGGQRGPEPVLVPDSAFLLREATAEERALRTARTLARRQHEQAAAREGLAARSAETKVTDKAVQRARGEIAVATYERAEAELLRVGAELFRYGGSSVDTPLDQFSQVVSPLLRRAQGRFAAVRSALVDDLNTPLNELRQRAGGFRSPAEQREAQESAA